GPPPPISCRMTRATSRARSCTWTRATTRWACKERAEQEADALVAVLDEAGHVDGDHMPIGASESQERPVLRPSVDSEGARKRGRRERQPQSPAAVDPERRVLLAHEASAHRRQRAVPPLAEERAPTVGLGQRL